MYILAKILEALGIGALGIAVVRGMYGDMRFEYYMFFTGVIVFAVGRIIEKSILKKRLREQERTL